LNSPSSCILQIFVFIFDIHAVVAEKYYLRILREGGNKLKRNFLFLGHQIFPPPREMTNDFMILEPYGRLTTGKSEL
jgi:hypothetical protein